MNFRQRLWLVLGVALAITAAVVAYTYTRPSVALAAPVPPAAAAPVATLTPEDQTAVMTAVGQIQSAQAQLDNLKLQLDNLQLRLRMKYKASETADLRLEKTADGKTEQLVFVEADPSPVAKP